MGFIKKLIVGCTAIFLLFFSGSGVKSDNFLVQAGAVLGIIIALTILYIFIKMAWRAMGCLPAIFIIFALTFFVMYAIGAFSGGNVSENIKEFLGQNIQDSVEMMENEAVTAEEETENKIKQKKEIVNLINEDQHKIFDGSIKDSFLSKNKNVNQKNSFNPMNYPAITGVARVLSGDTLSLDGYVVKLYAIAAPDIKQTCAARDGRGYRCGQQAAMWLSEWLSTYEIECHILQDNGQGVLQGVCLLGEYDIGAAAVNAGWAVADTRQSPIYQPYQNQAAENRRGIWDGKFYMPWDWQKMQNRKANIKIIHKKPSITRAHSIFF